jgi:hypothetical protein
MRQVIRRILLKQNFFPNWIGIFVNPFYFARAGLAKAVTRHAARLSGRLLDVGCGSMPYRVNRPGFYGDPRVVFSANAFA